MRPMGEQKKKTPKICIASEMVKGPDMRPVATLSTSSQSIKSRCKSAEERFLGRKVEVNMGGFPIGEP